MDGFNPLLFLLDLFFKASQLLFTLGHATAYLLQVGFGIPLAYPEQDCKKGYTPQDF